MGEVACDYVDFGTLPKDLDTLLGVQIFINFLKGPAWSTGLKLNTDKVKGIKEVGARGPGCLGFESLRCCV